MAGQKYTNGNNSSYRAQNEVITKQGERSLFDADGGALDLRTNPFQEGGSDEVI